MNLTCRNRLSWIVFTAALASAGCDKKADNVADAPKTQSSSTPQPKADKKADATGGKVASCNLIKTESICRQWGDDNIRAAGMDFIKGLCTTGDFKQQACPPDKRVGSCVTVEGTKVFYNDGKFPLAADKAEKQCKEGIPAGTWKAGQ